VELKCVWKPRWKDRPKVHGVTELQQLSLRILSMTVPWEENLGLIVSKPSACLGFWSASRSCCILILQCTERPLGRMLPLVLVCIPLEGRSPSTAFRRLIVIQVRSRERHASAVLTTSSTNLWKRNTVSWTTPRTLCLEDRVYCSSSCMWFV
jgi:hypothetical protein